MGQRHATSATPKRTHSAHGGMSVSEETPLASASPGSVSQGLPGLTGSVLSNAWNPAQAVAQGQGRPVDPDPFNHHEDFNRPLPIPHRGSQSRKEGELGPVRTVSWRTLPAHSPDGEGESDPQDAADASAAPTPLNIAPEGFDSQLGSPADAASLSKGDAPSPSDADATTLFLTTGVTYDPLPPPPQVVTPGRHGARRHLRGEGLPPPIGEVPQPPVPPQDAPPEEPLAQVPTSATDTTPLPVTLLQDSPLPVEAYEPRRGPSPILLVATSVVVTALILIPLQRWWMSRSDVTLGPTQGAIAQVDEASAATYEAGLEKGRPKGDSPSDTSALLQVKGEAEAPEATSSNPQDTPPKAKETTSPGPRAKAPSNNPRTSVKKSTGTSAKGASPPRKASPKKAAPKAAAKRASPVSKAQATKGKGSTPAPKAAPAAAASAQEAPGDEPLSSDDVARMLRGESPRGSSPQGQATKASVDVTDLLVAGTAGKAKEALPLRLYHIPSAPRPGAITLTLRTQGGPPSEVVVRWSVDGGPQKETKMLAVGADQFKASLSVPTGGTLSYHFYGRSAEAGNEANLRASSPFKVSIEPKRSAPEKRSPPPLSF